jgi:hypothetical protein
MIQTRNLNIDPDYYIEKAGLSRGAPKAEGMRTWVDYLHRELPDVKLGYFNPPVAHMAGHAR